MCTCICTHAFARVAACHCTGERCTSKNRCRFNSIHCFIVSNISSTLLLHTPLSSFSFQFISFFQHRRRLVIMGVLWLSSPFTSMTSCDVLIHIINCSKFFHSKCFFRLRTSKVNTSLLLFV